MTTADQVRQEEREAAAQHRHMERMRREAERARVAAEEAREREERRRRRLELTPAERDAKAACREYAHALRAANVRSNRPFPDDLDRALDRAYSIAMAKCGHTQRLRGGRW